MLQHCVLYRVVKECIQQYNLEALRNPESIFREAENHMKSIYLDHAASTPVHPEVAKVMYHILTEEYGNASSVHHSGRSAKRIVNGARDAIAGFLGCAPDEWVFTSGGTESDNLALLGAAAATVSKVNISLLLLLSIMRSCIPARNWSGRAIPSPISRQIPQEGCRFRMLKRPCGKTPF